MLLGEGSNGVNSFGQLDVFTMNVDIFLVDVEGVQIKLHINFSIVSESLLLEERYQFQMIDILPVRHRVDNVMRSFFLDQRKSWHIFVVEKSQCSLEVEKGHIGNYRVVLFVLIEELLCRGEAVVLYFSGPDRVQRHEKNITTPLFLDLEIDLGELFVF